MYWRVGGFSCCNVECEVLDDVVDEVECVLLSRAAGVDIMLMFAGLFFSGDDDFGDCFPEKIRKYNY